MRTTKQNIFVTAPEIEALTLVLNVSNFQQRKLSRCLAVKGVIYAVNIHAHVLHLHSQISRKSEKLSENICNCKQHSDCFVAHALGLGYGFKDNLHIQRYIIIFFVVV